MSYYKKTLYLDLIYTSSQSWELKEPERIGGAGFARIKLQDGRLSVQLQVRVVQAPMPSGIKEIRLESNGEDSVLLGVADFSGGCLRFQTDAADIALSGRLWEPEQIWGIVIPLSENYQVVGHFHSNTAVSVQKSDRGTETTGNQEPDVPETSEQETDVPEAPLQKPVYQEPTAQESSVQEPELQTSEHAGQDAPAAMPLPEGEETDMCSAHKSKWQMLTEYFEPVHPFQDNRVYLSVTPADFLIVSEEDFLLRDNRFLLHGYRNYKHLILGKMPDSTGKEEYYIGVPGIFYENEKKMAILFGFDGFESRTSRPEEGTFGYYMKRVRL